MECFYERIEALLDNVLQRIGAREAEQTPPLLSEDREMYGMVIKSVYCIPSSNIPCEPNLLRRNPYLLETAGELEQKRDQIDDET
jgi:hypothetical protein